MKVKEKEADEGKEATRKGREKKGKRETTKEK